MKNNEQVFSVNRGIYRRGFAWLTNIKATLSKCKDQLLTEIEFIFGEVTGHTKETQEKVEFFAKCLLYGTKNDLQSLYVRALGLLVPYKLSRYQHTAFYKLLPNKHKKQLSETRMIKIEKTNSTGDRTFQQNILIRLLRIRSLILGYVQSHQVHLCPDRKK